MSATTHKSLISHSVKLEAANETETVLSNTQQHRIKEKQTQMKQNGPLDGDGAGKGGMDKSFM